MSIGWVHVWPQHGLPSDCTHFTSISWVYIRPHGPLQTSDVAKPAAPVIVLPARRLP